MTRIIISYLSMIFMNLIIFVQTEETTRLFRYLMSNYNKDIRPVQSNSDIVTVKLGLKLMQIADVVCR